MINKNYLINLFILYLGLSITLNAAKTQMCEPVIDNPKNQVKCFKKISNFIISFLKNHKSKISIILSGIAIGASIGYLSIQLKKQKQNLKTKKNKNAKADKPKPEENFNEEDKCSLCQEKFNDIIKGFEDDAPSDIVQLNCGHIFCLNCIDNNLANCETGSVCPNCRSEIENITMLKNVTENLNLFNTATAKLKDSDKLEQIKIKRQREREIELGEEEAQRLAGEDERARAREEAQRLAGEDERARAREEAEAIEAVRRFEEREERAKAEAIEAVRRFEAQ